MDNSILLQKMRETIRKYRLYQPGEKTLVGFSGGADSVCLLYALLCLYGNQNVAAFHLNHMLRGEEALRDEDFCREFCAKYDIPFLCDHVNIREISGETSLEETARTIRYQKLEQAALSLNCSTVSLAHHAGDNLETMIFYLCRGTGLGGIAGIPVKRPLGAHMIVRPLLDLTKEEILSFLQENMLAYVTDSSNTDTVYTRNFIRHEIIPKLKQINANAEENARKTAEIAANAAYYIKEQALAFLASYPKNEIPVKDLKALSPALLYEILSVLYEQAGGKTLSSVQNASVIDLIFHKNNGASVSLTGNIIAKIDGKFLRIFHKHEENTAYLCEKIPLHWGKNILSDHLFVYLGIAADQNTAEKASFKASCKLPVSSLPSLHFRPRENGEGYRFGGMTRQFKKLLSSSDSAAKKRPILCNHDGILWHPNFSVADRIKEFPEIELFYVEI